MMNDVIERTAGPRCPECGRPTIAFPQGLPFCEKCSNQWMASPVDWDRWVGELQETIKRLSLRLADLKNERREQLKRDFGVIPKECL